MNIRINGRAEAVDKASTVAELIAMRGLSPDKIVVEHNRRIVPRQAWTDVSLQDDDNIEIVSFVGGG